MGPPRLWLNDAHCFFSVLDNRAVGGAETIPLHAQDFSDMDDNFLFSHGPKIENKRQGEF